MTKIKIFVITTELPGRIGGTPVRNYNLIKQIPKDKFSLCLFTILDNQTKYYLPKTEKKLSIPIYAVTSKRLSMVKKINALLVNRLIPYMEEYRGSGLGLILLRKINEEQPNIVQIETLNAYYAIIDILPIIKEKNIKIIFDAHNVEQIAFEESIKVFNLIKKIIGRWILPNFIKIENKAIKSVDYVFTCSDIDKAFFEKLVNSKIITVIPNGVDLMFFMPNKQVVGNTVLFMGKASYPPNEEALKYYFSEIHELVKKSIPDVKIYILCGKSPLWLKRIAVNDPSIILPGFVEDVREYLDKTRICISPIKSGSGTSLKILEYMAMSKPVVSTSKGVRGLDIENKKNILIADNPFDFANKIIWLIENPIEGKKIGARARKLIEERYKWNIISQKVESVYRELKYETK